MLYWFEQFGVAVGALSGILAARGKHVDLFGVVVLALVAAFGGGTIRDLALGDLPVFWVRDGNYILTAVGTALVAFFIARVHTFSSLALIVADAVVLAFFTMVGVKKALVFGAPAPVAVTMGVVTGVAGGILRDLLTGEIPLVFRRAIYLYATAALAGGTTLALLQHFYPDAPGNLVAGVVVTLALRLAGIRWKLALPLFQTRDGK